MLKEYALDPELLSNWRDFRFFTSLFGSAQGRLISRFPKKWKRMVILAAQAASFKNERSAAGSVELVTNKIIKQAIKDAAQNVDTEFLSALEKAQLTAVRNVKTNSRFVSELDFQRITEALNNMDSLMVLRTYNYDGKKEWLENAVEQNANEPFHAIVTSKNLNKTENVVIGDDINPTDMPELFIVPTSVQINRTPVAMAKCVEVLLSQCDEVMFVDPYFGPGKRAHTEPLQIFLEAIVNRDSRRMPTRVEYHTGNQDQDTSIFQENLEQCVKPSLPTGVHLAVVRWPKAEMHNRYILTDRGGVMFGHGLNKADGTAAPHDTVSLLDAKTCSELMIDYTSTSQKLTWLNDIFSVTGA